MKQFFIIFCLFFVVGCTINTGSSQPPKTVYVSVPLQLPEKPKFPKISSSSLECLTEDSKAELLNRDVVIKNYISELETIIISTQKKK